MNTLQHQMRAHIRVFLFCFGMLMANSGLFAATTNAILISVSITNGTPVMPRTIFSQTWTFQNTGTATWTNSYNGYTLNMLGKDTLGAVPLSAKPYVSPEPSASIDNGKQVAPGAMTTYTMDFIAPETSGSYTDTFRLNSSSSLFFGPSVTVQVVVMKAGSTNQYDRSRAVSYANNYSAYVCSDGYFWTNSSTFGTFVPGTDAPASGLGDDCAHFCSSCIGRPPAQWGGGLNIPTRDITYGEPGAAHLVYTDLIVPGYAVEVYSLTNLLPGDLVAWNWGTNHVADGNIADLDHVTFYLGNGLLASHSASALGVSANTWYQSGEPHYTRHLIHILDSPAIIASKTGNNLVLSWGTNWSSYALYASPSLGKGATWTKMIKSPSKIGRMNVITNATTSTAFYRLMMP
jgi:hypothetical protein